MIKILSMNLKPGKIFTPNNLTLARLVLSAVFFVLVAFSRPGSPLLFDLAVAVFILAGLTDMVDGYLARRYKMETSIGRLLDPFVDKVMVSGAFIFFTGTNFVIDGRNVTNIVPWIVTVVVARELLVTTLRGHSESQGQAFPATVYGKIKMFLQSATVVAILISVGRYHDQDWATAIRLVFIWTMVVTTLLSMIAYIYKYVTLNIKTEARLADHHAQADE